MVGSPACLLLQLAGLPTGTPTCRALTDALNKTEGTPLLLRLKVVASDDGATQDLQPSRTTDPVFVGEQAASKAGLAGMQPPGTAFRAAVLQP